MRLLLETALALFAGLMMTRVFKKMKLNFPDVTAYLIAGVLVGPFVLGRLGIHGIGFGSMEELESVSVLNNVALGFIAFDIGNVFSGRRSCRFRQPSRSVRSHLRQHLPQP